MGLAKVASQDHFGHAGGEEGSIVLQRLDCRDQVPCCIRFQKKAASACVQYRPHNLVRVVECQDENLDLRIVSQNLTSSFETVQNRHAYVEDGNIRLQFLGL